jgi:hypothetical protein
MKASLLYRIASVLQLRERPFKLNVAALTGCPLKAILLVKSVDREVVGPLLSILDSSTRFMLSWASS